MLDNKFNNNEFDEQLEFEFDIVPASLCERCRFITKCRKYLTIASTTQEIEYSAFESWEIDVVVIASVMDCKYFKPEDETILIISGGEEDGLR